MKPLGIKGDMNCDGSVDSEDIDPFFDAIGDAEQYVEDYPCCRILNGDLDCDDAVDSEDIDPFYDCLFGAGCDCP